MTDQHTPVRQLSAGQADTAVPVSAEPSAKPSRPRAPKPEAAAKPAAKGARSAARAGTPVDAADAKAAPVTDAPAAATPAREAAMAAPLPAAAAQDDGAQQVVAEPSRPRSSAGAGPARPAHRAEPEASSAQDAGSAESADAGDESGSSEDALVAAVGAAGDEPEVEVAELETGEADAPARDEEDEDDEEEEAPRSNARMPGMGGGMARPGMRPISPQLGGRPTPAPRIPSKAENFAEGDHVVYPTHGVGRVERIATEEIAGHKLELIHITFEENRMTLRVPVSKARSAGLRKLATRKMFDEALAVLRGRARIKRTMWSRRAQEYEAKINSGDPLSIAEVVRDLHRNAGQPDQSFSERQIYEAAMDRLAAEMAALDQTEKSVAATKLVDYLKTV